MYLTHRTLWLFIMCRVSEKNIQFSLFNPLDLKHSLGIVRGKSDAVDAYRIASYALSNKHKIKPYHLPVKELRKLKVLMSIRDRLVKTSVQLKNGVKSLEIEGESLLLK